MQSLSLVEIRRPTSLQKPRSRALRKPARYFESVSLNRVQSSAIELAEAIGLPLTHFVTINFSLTDIAPERAVEIFQLLRLRQFNKWARRPAINCDKPFIPAYVHFFENERDDHPFLKIGPGLPHNVHVRWPEHIPGDRLEDFQHRLWEWLDT